MIFWKYHGLGNDFILIEDPDLKAPVDPDAVVRLCDRRTGIGADGILYIRPDPEADAFMKIMNSDGSEAEMCGNGGRCAARFAYHGGFAPAALSFETLAGIIRAEILQDRVKLELPPASRPELGITLMLDGVPYTVSSITVGVPHAVVLVDDLEGCPVVTLGRQIRFHDRFKPAGTNADFVSIKDGSTIAVRTYERGVEDETLACGTGSVASALIAGVTRGMASPLSVITRGGEILTVHFAWKQGMPVELFLEGGADFIYEGQFYETLT